ncbi:MAG: UDP-N-acetylmuramate:L-alanyl-gamma-D-glutamyl-meso-diaminopimelate ligase [Desulfobacterales bacterium]|nr:UDP-N-acetylmuramate:L-alanyl-gamma-D-glutamyl-meso-diaminopimelate ligase [Desulfobacterales bacterium]MDD4073187.1 UDP-N-acetylmuramate:L-alanyl-gamma-D-glutamyl-meso-diaminopimelate ligase [Desulfobacterales bacterium]MDD4392240.1 UDP-N-acetylmuramate:L-alanyl-gamma-D-glutamyl-meso-diaminopimelate ligase [Desulfobacterales bacterium]
MDLTRNSIPDQVRKIHLIAVCGTGMGALAAMLKDKGYEITGSDQNVYPPMSTFLLQRGIQAASGFSEDNLADEIDLVVIGNAVRRDNPEVVKVMREGIFFCSMPQAVNHFIAGGKQPILVTGTHGKTTTSSILSWILDKAGLAPSFLIGGILKNFNSSYQLGSGQYIVLEGDEYDTAFFDKGSKFLHYDPAITILTSVEFDHADIFADIDHVKETFKKLLSGLAAESLLLAFDSDPHIRELLPAAGCRIQTYGKRPDSVWCLGQVDMNPPWTFFQVRRQGKHFASFKTRMVGEHNLLNAVSAVAASDQLGISVPRMAEALETFQGAKRRQEVRGCKRGITVIDDFAHHPTAVRETVKAVKLSHDQGRLIAVFEPRTNSSMRSVFQDAYPQSFDHADVICIRKPPLLHKIPENDRFSSEKLVEDLNARGKAAHYFPDTESIIEFLVQEARPGDFVLIMSNGGFDNIHERLLIALG